MAPYTPLSLRQVEGGCELRVRVIPGASRNAIDGTRDNSLLVRVTTAPNRGKANQEVARLLARGLKLKKAQVVLIRGAKNRNKAFMISGIEPALLKERLEYLIGGVGEKE